MSVIQMVANRIQARRRGGSDTTSNGGQSPASSISYSATGRLDSQEFSLVDESEMNGQSDSGDSEAERVSKDLFEDFDYEAEDQEPRHKPLKQAEKKPWKEVSPDVLMLQLESLQSQLVAAMLAKENALSEKQTVEGQYLVPEACTYTLANAICQMFEHLFIAAH